MKLTRIEVENFRCFKEASTFNLTTPDSDEPLDIALLVGSNGCGKSALLSAIAGFFTELYRSYGGPVLADSDIHESTDKAALSIEFRDTVSNTTQELSVHGMIFKDPTKFTKQPDDKKFNLIKDGGADFLPGFHLVGASAEFNGWLEAVEQPLGPTGLIVSFDTFRLMAGPLPGLPPRGEMLHHRCTRSLRPTLDGTVMSTTRATGLLEWIIQVSFHRSKSKSERGIDPVWDALRVGLDTLLAPYTFIGIDDHYKLLFRTPTGILPFESLSNGFRSVFLIVAELVFRVSLAAKNMEDIFEAEFVCLIDEIDAHLHPRWQEKLLPGLTMTFPNAQFIATTHSPTVINSVADYNVVFLKDQEIISPMD